MLANLLATVIVPMAKLESGLGNLPDQVPATDPGYGSVTLGADAREAFLRGLEGATNSPASETGIYSSRSFGTEPKDRSNEIDPDTGKLGPANVLSFVGGVRYGSAPTRLDDSHDVDQPSIAGITGRYSHSTPPGLDSYNDSVARVTVIGRDGAVSSRFLVA